ncbi:MAG: methyltransferase domain-containing protein [Polyangiaceae bacterium]|nr:methyltransferase domain-containing protein [Polyangiaceae bacterium]
MPGQLAARRGDEVGHTMAAAWMKIGLCVGAALVVVAGAAVVVATGGVAAVVAGATVGTTMVAAGGATAAVAGGGLLGLHLGEAENDGPSCSVIETGSEDTFIEGKEASRAGLDTVGHDDDVVASGSSTVFVNRRPLARIEEKCQCGGRLIRTSARTLIGGDTALAIPPQQMKHEAGNAPLVLNALLWGGLTLMTGGMASGYMAAGWGARAAWGAAFVKVATPLAIGTVATEVAERGARAMGATELQARLWGAGAGFVAGGLGGRPGNLAARKIGERYGFAEKADPGYSRVENEPLLQVASEPPVAEPAPPVVKALPAPAAKAEPVRTAVENEPVAKAGPEEIALEPAPPPVAEEAVRLGDLRPHEIEAIQRGADQLGEDIYVVGSAAKGQRRNLDTDLPFKDLNGGLSKHKTRSDIDYAVRNGADDAADKLGLPDVDPEYGVRGIDYINLKNSPAIRFGLNKPPEFLRQGGERIMLGQKAALTNASTRVRVDPRSYLRSGAEPLTHVELPAAGEVIMPGQGQIKVHGQTFSITDKTLEVLVERGAPEWAVELESLRGRTVIDVGSGHGAFTRQLQAAGADATGVDIAGVPPQLPGGPKFKQGDASKLPFPDASFDVAFSNWSVFYYYDRILSNNITDACLAELVRVVRPGGEIRLIRVHEDVIPHIERNPLLKIDKGKDSKDQYGDIQALLIRRIDPGGSPPIETGP